MSYLRKDKETPSLFSELMPYGGKLNQQNRWMQLHDKIPWGRLEDLYQSYHVKRGRRVKDSQLINGLLIVKHMENVSDRRVVDVFLENPYIQYFCGYRVFVTNDKEVNHTTLSKVRGRLGAQYFREFERALIELLKQSKVLKGKEQMVDATVYPADIRYPTDTGILEDVRQWLVKSIQTVKRCGEIKMAIRTYCRKARGVYVAFQRKRRKTKREVRRATRQMVQYVRRNINQLKFVLDIGKRRIATIMEWAMIEGIERRLKEAEKIYQQQFEMLKRKVHTIEDRIVSFHKTHIRPIVRGKAGRDVEFGPKCTVSYVDGCLFLDKLSFASYHEGVALPESIAAHRERFQNDPKVLIADKIYGTRVNRTMLGDKKIQASLFALGRRSVQGKVHEQWVRAKQRRRNRIEGAIGTSKTRYGLGRLRYHICGGEEINIRLGLSAMNLATLLAKA